MSISPLYGLAALAFMVLLIYLSARQHPRPFGESGEAGETAESGDKLALSFFRKAYERAKGNGRK